ncbi:hypothetical protein F5Y16DRAFT_418411 [Xylariaceae sp. FL0255]|nr:hypothetical protein F5Y16DRAFT_418411 [Xylariaceae sp. FL0255]
MIYESDQMKYIYGDRQGPSTPPPTQGLLGSKSATQIISSAEYRDKKATFAVRNLILFEETKAEHFFKTQKAAQRAKTEYARLHRIARFAVVVCEILLVNVKTLDYIVACHEEFMKQRLELRNADEGRSMVALVSAARGQVGAEEKRNTNIEADMHRIHQQLRLFAHTAFSLHCRCSSYLSRIQNQIQLLFNVISQDKAGASVAIARATKADSETMKVTSFIALVFLPPTFISAIFSTSFFNFGEDAKSWQVSEKFWWYWVITIPVTSLCLLVWYGVFFRRAAMSAPWVVRRVVPVGDLESNEAVRQISLDSYL